MKQVWNALLVANLMANTVAAQECAQWSQRFSEHVPGAIVQPVLTYDSDRGLAVLFSAVKDENARQTLVWGGVDWELRATDGPSRRIGTALAYDSERGRCVLFGGSDRDDTWEWDGQSWVQRWSGDFPDAREFHSMAFDSDRGVTVLYGGTYDDDEGGRILGDTWEWDGTAWTKHADSGPGPSYNNTMAYDTARGVTVLYGGAGYRSTWEWDGAVWTFRTDQGPGFRSNAAMVYDADLQSCILFGGAADNQVLNDTWAWDGQVWKQLTPAGSPAGRRDHAMAYDSDRHAIVLFGGRVGDYFYDDTWEFTCPSPCYPDFDADGDLTLFDFLAFVNGFNAAAPDADCDGNKVFDLFDFLCFVNAFNGGC